MYDVGKLPEDNLFSNNCFIDVNGDSIPVVNGYVTDPVSKTRTKLEFFYLSDSEKMIHIDFEDALEEIRYALKNHRCRKANDKEINESRNDNQFVYVCQKLEDLNKKIDDLMGINKEHPQGSCKQRNKTKIVVDIHKENNDSSSYGNSESENQNEIKNNCNTTQLSLQHSVDNNIEHNNGQSLVRKLYHSEKSFFISAEDLKVITDWVSKNRSFLPYKGKTEVPIRTVETDDNYLIALLCSLNPTVVLEKLFFLDSQRPNNESIHREISGELSQEEFAKYLGLTQRKAFEDSQHALHSKKLRSKSNLARQNKFSSSFPSFEQTKSPNKIEQMKNVDSDNTSTSKLEFSKLETMKSGSANQTFRKHRSHANHRSPKEFKDKAPYTIEEDKAILNWVLKDQNATKVNGNTIWRELENKPVVPIRGRSWQSLRNRFLKNILNQLREYNLKKEDIHIIIKGAQKGTLFRKYKMLDLNPSNHVLMSKKGVNNKLLVKKTPSKTQSPESKSKLELRSAKRKTVGAENKTIYSDVEVISQEQMNTSHREYQKKAKIESNQMLIKNQTQATRSRGKKLFTQRTFVASMSDSTSIG